MENLQQVIEAILLVSGDGISKGDLIEKLRVLPEELDAAIVCLQQKYRNEASGILLISFSDKIQLCSNPKYAESIAAVLNPIREKQLTKTTLETMAIIAYKQPVTRLEIEEIRGVNSDYAIQTLLGFELIEVVGRKDALGKPLLFGTTDVFLKRFQLKSLADLPAYEELLSRIKVMEQTNPTDLFDHTDYENKLVDESVTPSELTQAEPEVTPAELPQEEMNPEPDAEKETEPKEDIKPEPESESEKESKPKEETAEKPEPQTKPAEPAPTFENLPEEKPAEPIALPKKKKAKRGSGSLFEIGGEQSDLFDKINDDIPDFLLNEKNIEIIE